MCQVLVSHHSIRFVIFVSRYCWVSSYERGTICKFDKNASSMKHLAVQDFEDLLQVHFHLFIIEICLLSQFIKNTSVQHLALKVSFQPPIILLFSTFFSTWQHGTVMPSFNCIQKRHLNFLKQWLPCFNTQLPSFKRQLVVPIIWQSYLKKVLCVVIGLLHLPKRKTITLLPWIWRWSKSTSTWQCISITHLVTIQTQLDNTEQQITTWLR